MTAVIWLRKCFIKETRCVVRMLTWASLTIRFCTSVGQPLFSMKIFLNPKGHILMQLHLKVLLIICILEWIRKLQWTLVQFCASDLRFISNYILTDNVDVSLDLDDGSLSLFSHLQNLHNCNNVPNTICRNANGSFSCICKTKHTLVDNVCKKGV